MTLPVWPTGVSYQPERDTFSLDQPYPAASVTQFEDGPDRLRRRAFTRIKKAPYRIILEGDEMCATARAFLEDTLQDGTLRFTMPVRMPGAIVFTPRTVFLDQATYKMTEAAPSIWSLTFVLCVMPG